MLIVPLGKAIRGLCDEYLKGVRVAVTCFSCKIAKSESGRSYDDSGK